MCCIQRVETADSGGRPAGPACQEDAGRPAAAAVGGGAASILDRINKKLPPTANTEEAIARKCKCSSVWCPECYRRFHLERHYLRLSEIPWDECRFITLTMDSLKTGNGADAFIFCREKKILGRFIQNLKREGIKVNDWCGQMEFHKNGNPHFHILVRTCKGPSGKIGNEMLLKAWPWGYVHEDYFKTEKDYNRVVGYFGKTGYFHKGKEYQTALPDYFKSEYFRGMKIQRFFSARRPSTHKAQPKIKNPNPKQSKSLTWNTIHQCGKRTIIFYYKKDESGFNDTEQKFLQVLDVPYEYFKVMFWGKYVQGRGYIFSLTGTKPDTPPCPY